MALHAETPGTIDPDFNVSVGGTSALIADVASTAVQPDGRIVVAGDFNTINGEQRNALARLHANGTLDLSFSPNL